MDIAKYRAWVYERQGLGRRRYASAREALVRAGWQRSVGGANPYLAIRARSGESRARVDALAADLQLFELPSARGCTYVLPADHFTLGLAIGRGVGSNTEFAIARKLGVTDAEIDALKTAVVAALAHGALTPAELKTTLGDKVRNLGEEGKRRGLTTTLPLALGLLQTEGRIRRKPVNGRLDSQRYAYEAWNSPPERFPTEAEAADEIARLYFGWIGTATLKDFREFTAFSAKMAQSACDRAGLIPFADGTDLLCLPGAREEFAAFDPSIEPIYSLVGNLDTFLILRRTHAFWLQSEDAARLAPTDKGLRPVSEFSELWSHAILDRGRLVGLWEFDADEGRIAWMSWNPVDDALLDAVESVEQYVRDDLGDARSFSLDSPGSRRPRLDALHDLQKSNA